MIVLDDISNCYSYPSDSVTLLTCSSADFLPPSFLKDENDIFTVTCESWLGDFSVHGI